MIIDPVAYMIWKLISKEPAGQRDLDDPRVKQAIRKQLQDRREQLLKAAYYESSARRFKSYELLRGGSPEEPRRSEVGRGPKGRNKKARGISPSRPPHLSTPVGTAPSPFTFQFLHQNLVDQLRIRLPSTPS